MTKLFASRMAERAASHCVEVFGANGFVRDSPAEKYYRDAKVGSITKVHRICNWRRLPSRRRGGGEA
jgi:alkylation response protein AidB-like acyl-CoA dehydrogenase